MHSLSSFDIDKNFSSLPETVGLWERDKHKTKQGFRGNNHAHCKTKIALALGILALTAQAQADQLADIKAAGVVKVATFDANPPFGSVDPKPTSWWVMMSISPGAGKIAWGKTGAGSHQPGQPVPLLQSGKADLIVADITITPERAQVIDFSTPYFVTGQQFLVPAKSADQLDSYSKARIGAVKGTTGEQALHQRFRSRACSPMTIFRWR